MTLEQQQVRKWMQHGQQECPNSPQFPTDNKVWTLRLQLIQEELNELDIAGAEDSLVEVADALADLMVVVLGTAVACGIDLEPIFQEVMRSNNTKLVKDGDGKLTAVKNHHGKIMKPDSYTPPNLQPILSHQLANPLV